MYRLKIEVTKMNLQIFLLLANSSGLIQSCLPLILSQDLTQSQVLTIQSKIKP